MPLHTMHTHILTLCAALLLFSGPAYGKLAPQPDAAKPTVPSGAKDESGPHFTRARELYALGPSRAKEVIAELDLELQDHPENLKALLLKAMTQMGIEQFEAVLATLDQHDEITAKNRTIAPNAIYLRARCLFYKGDYAAAKEILGRYSAFFLSDPGEKSLYESLMAAIVAKLNTPKDEDLEYVFEENEPAAK